MTGNRQQTRRVIDHLNQLIDKRSDDVRLYPITQHTRIWGLGTQFDDNGNTLCDTFLDQLIQNHDGDTHNIPPDDRLSSFT